MSFQIKETEKTPYIEFSSSQGVLKIKGISIPEDSRGFYTGLNLEIEEYLNSPNPETFIEFQLEYFNTSTTIILKEIMSKFNTLHATSKSTVKLVWVFEEDDLDMEDAGLEYKALFSNMPFDVKSVTEFDFR